LLKIPNFHFQYQILIYKKTKFLWLLPNFWRFLPICWVSYQFVRVFTKFGLTAPNKWDRHQISGIFYTKILGFVSNIWKVYQFMCIFIKTCGILPNFCSLYQIHEVCTRYLESVSNIWKVYQFMYIFNKTCGILSNFCSLYQMHEVCTRYLKSVSLYVYFLYMYQIHIRLCWVILVYNHSCDWFIESMSSKLNWIA
jgi:hypothetical protein